MEYNENFENSKIPLDVLWMDIPHTDGNKYFHFSNSKFPTQQLEQMNQQIDLSDRRLVVITDPHIKKDSYYDVYTEGLFKNKQWVNGSYVNIFVEDKNNNVFIGFCWPGDSAYIDYFNEGARDYWSAQYASSHFQGTNALYGIWNDMNEPSVFNGPEQTLPKDSHHFASDGQYVEHKDLHNAYGRMMIEATYNGVAQRSPDYRPFVLTRSTFFGSQKYGAKWTGDNWSTFQEMEVSIPMMLSLGLAGMHFVGADIPGFAGNPNDDLYMKFYQLGMFYPFFRGHGHIDYPKREPYLQSDVVQEVVKTTIFLRYELIHYIYTMFYISSSEGLPIMRPVW